MPSSDRILPPTFEELGPSDPRVIGGFELLGRLGAGGMGTAYLAQGSGQWVVIKVLKEDLAEDPTFRARLRRELDALSRVKGSGAVRVVQHDLDAPAPWFAMEFVEGQTLADRVKTAGPMSGNTLAGFAKSLAERIEEIHQAGITHRDIKPTNIVISPAGPRIIDFGIAVLDERTAMTSTGVLVGTLGWASPEQVAGDSVSFPADIHAWGLCVLYAATGDSPFDAENPASMVYKVVHMQPKVPAGLPQGLTRSIEAALRKDPVQRPSLAEVISGDIHNHPIRTQADPATRVQPPPSRRRGVLLGAIVGIAVALAAGGIALAVIQSVSTGPGPETTTSTTPPPSGPTSSGPSSGPAPESGGPTQPPESSSSEPRAPETAAPIGYEEQITANALMDRMNRDEWSSIPDLCTPPSLCTRQFVDFFQPRFMSGQFRRGDVGMLYSCADPVPSGWQGGCTKPGRWLAQFDWTCSKGGTQGVQREVGYFEFDYTTEGARISAFEPVNVIEPASECTG